MTVIADAVYVLHSARLYNKPRTDIAALLLPLVRLPHFRVQNRRIVVRALTIYGHFASGFGDAMILAAMEAAGATELYSYDERLGKSPGIVRREPNPLIGDGDTLIAATALHHHLTLVTRNRRHFQRVQG